MNVINVLMSNNWPKVMMIAVLTMIIIGQNQYVMTSSQRIRRRYNERFIMLFSIVFSAISSIMILVESGNGIIQMFDDTLAVTDSPAWSVILTPWVVMFVGMIFCVMLYSIGTACGWMQRGRLVSRCLKN